MIDQATADRYLEEKRRFEAGELDLTPDEVALRRGALLDFGEELERSRNRQKAIREKDGKERVRRYFNDLPTLGGNFGEAEEDQYRWAVDKDSIRANIAVTELLAHRYELTPEEVNQKRDALRMEYANQRFKGKIPKTDVEFWHAEKAEMEHDETIETETRGMIGAAASDAIADSMKRLGPNGGGSLNRWKVEFKDSLLIKETAPEKLDPAYQQIYRGAFDLMDRNPALLDAAQMMAKKAGRTDLMRDKEAPEVKGLQDEPALNAVQMKGRLAAQKIAKTGEEQPTTEKILDKLMQVPKEDLQRFFDLLPAYLKAAGEPDPEAATATFMSQLWGEFAQGYSTMMGDRKAVQNQMERDAKVLRAIQSGKPVRTRAFEGGYVELDQLVTEADVALTNAVGGFGTGLQTYSHSGDDYGRKLSPEEAKTAVARLQERITRGKFFFQVEQMTKEMNPLRAVTPFEDAEMGAYAIAGSAPMMARGIVASFLPAGPLLAFVSSADAMRAQEFQRLLVEFPDVDIERAGKVATLSGLAQAVPEMASTYGMRFGGSLLVRKAPTVAKALERFSSPTSSFWTPFLTRTGVGVAEEVTEEAVQGVISAAVQNAILTDYPKADVKKAFLDNISPEVGFASLFMRLPAVGAGTWSDSRKVREGLESREMMKGLGLSDEVVAEINGLAGEGKYSQAETRMREEYGRLSMEKIEAGARYLEQTLGLTVEASTDPDAENAEALKVQDGQWSIVRKKDGVEVASFGLDGDAASAELEQRKAYRRERQERDHDGSVRRFVNWFRAQQDGRIFEEYLSEDRRAFDEPEDKPLNAEALAASIRMARIEAGYDPAQLIIKGVHVEELREGIYRDVVRLYKGADFTTVIEENAHAQLQADIREGRVSWEEAAQWAREWSAATGFELKDAANPTHAEIQEAVADMAKAHFMNERKRLPDKPKVWGLVKSLRAYLREVFGRAKMLIQMREEGKLSESAESYLARTLGMDEQLELNQKTVEAIGVEAQPSLEPVGGASFSIGVLDENQEMPWRDPAKAIGWALKNLRNEYPNRATASKFVVNRTTIDHTFNHSKMQGSKVRVLEAIEDIIAEARPVHTEEAYSGTRNGVVASRFFYAPLIVDGKLRIARIVVHRMEERVNQQQVYDVKSIEMDEAQIPQGPGLDMRDVKSGVLRFDVSLPHFVEIVKKAYPGDFPDSSAHYSIGHASYLEELATAQDAAMGGEAKLKLAEAARSALEAGRARVDFLEREVIYEQKADARALQLEEDIANLQLSLDERLEKLRQAKAEKIAEAGTTSMAKFMDRIDAAKTEREKMLLRREARETAADLKRSIETDFKRQEQTLREKARGEEKVLREKALGRERAEQLKVNFDDARAATLNSLVDYNHLMRALPAELRGKLGGFVTLARLKTDAARDKFFREKFPKVAEAFEKHLKKEYDEALKSIFKKAAPKKKAGKKAVGKMDPDLHALFATLRDAMHWDAAEMEGQFVKWDKREDNEQLTPEQEDMLNLTKAMVNLVVDWKNADSGRRGKAVAALKELLQKGLTEYRFAKAQERTARAERRERLRAATGSDGSGPALTQRKKKDSGMIGKRLAFLRAARLNLSTFEQVLFLCFGEGDDVQRIVDMQRMADFAKQDADHAIADKVNALLSELAGGSFKGQQLHDRLSKQSIEVRGISMSELEAISVSMMWRQEDGRRHMEGRRDEEGNLVTSWGYDQEFVDMVEAELSNEALRIREFLTKEYEAEYARLNAIYRKLNGVDLPKHLFYSPITVKPMQAKAGEMVDPTTGIAMSAGSSLPGSLRTRGISVAEPDFKDVLLTFMQHKTQMNHWMAYAEFVKEFQALIGHREVMNAVQESSGEGAKRILGQWLDYFAQGGNRDAAARLELVEWLSGVVSNASAMALVGRAGVLAVQSTQLLTALSEMPTTAYLKRMGMLMAGQLNAKAAWNSAYIQRRLKEMPPVVRQLMEGLNSDSPTRLKDVARTLGKTISGADAFFTAGTYAIVFDYQKTKLLKAGLKEAQAEQQAHFEAERITDRLAQPIRAGARSMIELRTSGSPFTRMLWNFASDSRKNVGLMLFAAAKRPLGQALKTVGVLWVLNGLMSNLIRAAWRDARDSEDEDIFDEKNWDLKRMALAVLTEPLAGVPVIGDVVEDALNTAAGVYQPSGSLVSVGRAIPAFGRQTIDRLTGENDQDTREVLRDVESILMAMGLGSANFAAAASLSHIVRDLFGVADNVTESEK